MRSSVSFILDNKVISEDFKDAVLPTTTVLNYLRSLPVHKGVKEGCAEGDCGACTVVLGELAGDKIKYTAVNSCLVFLPMIHGKQLVTVENLKSADGALHPVQQAMVETGGSQCGFCTPGFIMSMFALYKNHNQPNRETIDDALTGNLCRCTGYRPIVEASAKSCVHCGLDSLTSWEPNVVQHLRSIERSAALIETKHQTYFQPRTLLEALTLKHQHTDAVVICGATDVALRVTKKHELLKKIIDLSLVDELQQIQDDPDCLRIGSAATLSSIEGSIVNFPALRDTFRVFGSVQIRNLATLGGNIGSASPIGDTLSALIPYGAKVVLQSVADKREVLLENFITGYRKTVRADDELIVEIIVPRPSPESIIKWYKVSKRKDLDISTISAGFRLELDSTNKISSVTLAYGGMAEQVKRARSAEDFLQGKLWSRETVEQAMPFIDKDFTPISDARAGKEFRQVAARNLLLKFWSETSPEKGKPR